MTQRKRSHREFQADDRQAEDVQADDGAPGFSTNKNGVGIGATLALLRDEPRKNTSHARQRQIPRSDEEEDGWQVAESRFAKRRRKQREKSHDTDNYPAIYHSTHNRLQSYVKISDLQALVLYLLADGTAPQWMAVRHHGQVRKVVVLMVPGLEAGMFDGTIPLSVKDVVEETKDKTSTPETGTEITAVSATTNIPVHQNYRYTDKQRLSPDDYYPVKLVSDLLPEPLRPLSEVFPHMWFIKTPGDERYNRMHSPVAAMLTTPIPKSKEAKRGSGPQTPRAAKDWKNEPTPITSFLATSEELVENEYLLHPVNFDSPEGRSAGLRRRVEHKQTSEYGWVDSNVEPSAVAGSTKIPKVKGDLTAGKEVIAMDCEMCKTADDSFELTRISLVGWDGKVLLDQLVKPDNPIIDYLTP